MISVLAAGLGLVIAFWGVDMIRAGMPADVERFIPGWKQMRLDGRALFFTFGVAVMAGIISGLAPALQSSSPNLNTRGSSAGRARRTLRNALVAVARPQLSPAYQAYFSQAVPAAARVRAAAGPA